VDTTSGAQPASVRRHLLGQPLVAVPLDRVAEAVASLPEELRAPTRHVITEQARVLAFANALREHDLVAMGELMRASHESLRDDFGVTGCGP
jgi:galactokinase